MTLKILNLYAGIGGNRKLWAGDIEVTAVENDPKIAAIYKDFFPEDKVIVGDAHEYLLEHFEEYNFIWASPPCPTHSRLRKGFVGTKFGAKPIYPDMRLYQEILLLKHYFKGKWVIENVNPFYTPLIEAQKIGRHLFWNNLDLPDLEVKDIKFSPTNKAGKNTKRESDKEQIERLSKELGFDISSYVIPNKRTLLRNCVNPQLSLKILNFLKRRVNGEGFFRVKQENNQTDVKK